MAAICFGDEERFFQCKTNFDLEFPDDCILDLGGISHSDSEALGKTSDAENLSLQRLKAADETYVRSNSDCVFEFCSRWVVWVL